MQSFPSKLEIKLYTPELKIMNNSNRAEYLRKRKYKGYPDPFQ